MKLYIAATPDKYELPIFVAYSAVELARMCGYDPQRIYQAVKNQRRPTKDGKPHTVQKGTEYKFFAVEVDD